MTEAAVSTETFGWWGEALPYCRTDYNFAGQNERAVEVPIAQRFVAHQPEGGLELGNVLSHYGPVQHRVIDRWEEAEGVENLDVLELIDPVPWFVSISTIEHVRWDEPGVARDPTGAPAALNRLLDLLLPGGAGLVTVPLGWHPAIDRRLLDGTFRPWRQCTYVREADGAWRQIPHRVEWRPYGGATPWAAAVWVGEFRRYRCA